ARQGLVDEACANRDGIARMGLGRVTAGDGRRDAALRPGARRAFTDRRRGHNRGRAGTELERAEQPGDATANDDYVVGAVGHGSLSRRLLAPGSDADQAFRLTMRSTERRARAAIAGSITTSSFR